MAAARLKCELWDTTEHVLDFGDFLNSFKYPKSIKDQEV